MVMQERVNIQLVGQPNAALTDLTRRIDQQQEILIEGNVDRTLVTQVNRLDNDIVDSRNSAIRLERSIDDIDDRGPREAARGVRTITNEAREADRSIDGLSGGLGRLGTSVAGLAGIGGTIFLADQLGEEAAQILAAAEQTELTVETIQELRNRAALINQDLDFGDFQEIANRIGEIRQEAIRNINDADFEGATIGARESLEDLGLAAEEVTQRDIPAILDALSEIDDRATRAFLGDEIFSTFFERIAPSLNLPPDLERRLENTNTLGRETLEQFRANRIELMALGRDFQITGATVLSDFIGPMMTASMTLRNTVVGFNDIVDTNPALVAALGAAGVATLALAHRTSILNTALAVRAALSGPAGIASLAVAAGIVGFSIYSANRGAQIQEEDNALEDITERQRDATFEGVRAGANEIADEVSRVRDDTLRAITPGLDCLDDRLNQVVDAVVGEEEPTPTPPARPEVAFGEQGIEILQQEAAAVRDINPLIPDAANIIVSDDAVRLDIPSAVEQITQTQQPIIRSDQTGPGATDYLGQDGFRGTGLGQFLFGRTSVPTPEPVAQDQEPVPFGVPERFRQIEGPVIPAPRETVTNNSTVINHNYDIQQDITTPDPVEAGDEAIYRVQQTQRTISGE